MAYVSDFGVKTLKLLLSLGPTYFFMKFIECKGLMIGILSKNNYSFGVSL